VGKSGVPLAQALRLPFIPVTRVENYCASGTEAFRGAVYAVAIGALRLRARARRGKAQGCGLRRLPQRSRGVQLDVLAESVRRPAASPKLAGRLRSQARLQFGRPETGDGPHLGQEPRQRARNPKAHLQNKITRRYRDERADGGRAGRRPVSTAAGVSDGSACAIVTTPEIAKGLGESDIISVTGAAVAWYRTASKPQHNSWDGSYFATTRIASTRAYAEAGIKNPREQIDLIEVHELFLRHRTSHHGRICTSRRRAERIKARARRIYDADGTIPCQIDGGLKCFRPPDRRFGLAHDLRDVSAAAPAAAGPRQRKKPPVFGLTHNLGGFPHQNVCSISIVGRYGA